MLRDLKRELTDLKEQFDKVTRKANKLETSCKETGLNLENMTRDYNEVNLRLNTYQGSLEELQKLNEDYRTLVFNNESIMAQ